MSLAMASKKLLNMLKELNEAMLSKEAVTVWNTVSVNEKFKKKTFQNINSAAENSIAEHFK